MYAAIDFCLIRTTKEWKILLLVFLERDERGRNRKCINAGYGACVRSMIPHYTQIMQSPSLLHAAGRRTNKTTSGGHPEFSLDINIFTGKIIINTSTGLE